MTATIVNPLSGTTKATNTLNIDVFVDCNLAVLVDRQFNDMTSKVTKATTQDITFKDTMGQLMSNDAQCGPRVYTFTPELPSFLTLDKDQTKLTLMTNNVAQVGTFDFEF